MEGFSYWSQSIDLNDYNNRDYIICNLIAYNISVSGPFTGW